MSHGESHELRLFAESFVAFVEAYRVEPDCDCRRVMLLENHEKTASTRRASITRIYQ